MIAESTGLAQVEKPVASTGAEDNALQTSTAELSIVEFVRGYCFRGYHDDSLRGAGHDLALTKPAIGLVSAPSEMAPASTGIVRIIIEWGSWSAPTELAPAMDIIEELAH